MSAARHIDLATIPAQHWKNGAGLTREIAVWPPGAGIDAFEWRLSVAELERAAPFSAFPGVDRSIVVLHGAGMELLDDRGAAVQVLRPLQPWSFAGELTLHARLPEGRCRDFNVMTRRGRWRAAVQLHRSDATLHSADAALLLAVQGRWRAGTQPLDAMQGLLWPTPVERVVIGPQDPGAVLLQVRLCQDRRS